MNKRHFHLRLSCTYLNAKNEIDALQLDVLKDGKWESLDLNTRSPGFLLFINGLFSCQHLYLRSNCAERSLILKSVNAELQVETSEIWEITAANASFEAVLQSGQPSENDISYILERMKHCPVSTNLRETIPLNNTVRFSPV